MTSYEYDGANQLLSMKSAEGLRTFKYDKSGRLVEELLDGKTVASYKYGYLDKVTEVNRNGKITKFKYDGFGMLAQKTFHDGKTEDWVWDGMALVMRGNDIYVNEPHVSGGTPLLTKTDKGVRYHTSDFLGTTLWSTDIRGKALDSYADTSVFGEGSIQQDRAARFTGKPYDEDLQAYVFPYRNYDPKLARWTSSDPSGFPDGINQHFYAAIPTYGLDPLGTDVLLYSSEITPEGGSVYNILNPPMSFKATLNLKFTGNDKTLAKEGKYFFGLRLDSIDLVIANPRIIVEENDYIKSGVNLIYNGLQELGLGEHTLSAYIVNAETLLGAVIISSTFTIER